MGASGAVSEAILFLGEFFRGEFNNCAPLSNSAAALIITVGSAAFLYAAFLIALCTL